MLIFSTESNKYAIILIYASLKYLFYYSFIKIRIIYMAIYIFAHMLFLNHDGIQKHKVLKHDNLITFTINSCIPDNILLIGKKN